MDLNNKEDYKSLTSDILNMNLELRMQFGHLDDGRPNFRIVWSDDQFEWRTGTYRIFKGPLFIREEVGTLKVPKYNYLKERYILEVIQFNVQPEIVNSEKGHYEPLFPFEDAKGNYLIPNLEVARILCSNYLRATDPEYKKNKPKRDFDAEEQARKKKEAEFFFDYLNHIGRSELFYDNKAAFIDSTKIRIQ